MPGKDTTGTCTECRAPSVVGILDQSIPRSVGLITKQGSIASLPLVEETYSAARVHVRMHALCTGVLTGYDSSAVVSSSVFTNTRVEQDMHLLYITCLMLCD